MAIVVRYITLFVAINIMIGCGNSDQTLISLMTKTVQVDIIKNMSMTVTENGALKMYLYAHLLHKYNNDSSRFYFPKGVKVTLYNDSAKAQTYCISKYADYWKRTGLLLLKDSVVIWNIKGDTLITDELWWDRNTQKIYTDEPIFIYQPGSRMKGTCWRSNDNLTNYSICNMEGVFEKAGKNNPFQ